MLSGALLFLGLLGLLGGPAACRSPSDDLAPPAPSDAGEDMAGSAVTDLGIRDASGPEDAGGDDLGPSDPCADTPFPEDALAYYRLDGPAPEAGPGGVLTRALNAASAPDRRGDPAGAIRLESGSIELGAVFEGLRLPVSLSVWIQPDDEAEGRFRMVLETADTSGLPGAPTYRGLWLQLSPSGTVGASFGNGGPANPTGRRSVFSTDAVPATGWVHVAAVLVDPMTMELYVGGEGPVEAGLSGDARFLVPGPGRAYLGGTGRGDSEAYSGALDDLRIFLRRLDACEIERLAEE